MKNYFEKILNIKRLSYLPHSPLIFLNIFIIFLVNFYQMLPKFFPVGCRYSPSCSEYTKEAFSKYPFVMALKISLKRIFRCHPFAGAGFDPLPLPKSTSLPKNG